VRTFGPTRIVPAYRLSLPSRDSKTYACAKSISSAVSLLLLHDEIRHDCHLRKVLLPSHRSQNLSHVVVALVVSTHHVERIFQGFKFMPRFHHILIPADNLSNCLPQRGVTLEGFEHFHCNTFMHPRNKRGYYRRSRKIRVDGFTMSLWGRWRDDSLRTSSGDTNMWTKRRRFYAHKILDWWLGVVDLPCTSITWASHVGKG